MPRNCVKQAEHTQAPVRFVPVPARIEGIHSQAGGAARVVPELIVQAIGDGRTSAGAPITNGMTAGNGDNPRDGIGALFKRFREEQRVTQRELAAAAGMSVGALRDLEQGRTGSPRWTTVEELAAVLGLGQAQRAELRVAFGAGRRSTARRRERPAERPPGLRIDILGPLVAWRDGALVALGPARQRAVLGLLAVHAGASVPREAIVDMLWGERPPASAIAEVQRYVSRLRKTLRGTGPAELVTTADGRHYQLSVGANRLDLAAFGELTRQARQAAAQGDPAGATRRYEQALRLWRGDILADIGLLRDHPAVVEAARRLADAVLGYAEAADAADAASAAEAAGAAGAVGAVDAAGATGARFQVLPYLRELCTREPLNERAHACLMTALAAIGQQAAALTVFTDLRRRLDAELGISPSQVLAQAHARVLRQQFGPPGHLGRGPDCAGARVLTGRWGIP